MAGESEGNKPKLEVVWSAIGKVGVVIALILGINSVYGVVRPEKARLVAKCHALEVPERPPQRSSSSSPDNPAPDSASKQDLANQKDAGADAQVVDEYREQIARLNEKIVDEEMIIRCDLRNSGRREAKDIVLGIPLEPEAARLGNLEIVGDALGDDHIRVGSLRPQAENTLVVWGSGMGTIHELWDDDDFSLSYADGVGDVYVAKSAYGVLADSANFLNIMSREPLFFGVVLITAVLLIISLFFRAKEGQSKPGDSMAPSAPKQEVKQGDGNGNPGATA